MCVMLLVLAFGTLWIFLAAIPKDTIVRAWDVEANNALNHAHMHTFTVFAGAFAVNVRAYVTTDCVGITEC